MSVWVLASCMFEGFEGNLWLRVDISLVCKLCVSANPHPSSETAQ